MSKSEVTEIECYNPVPDLIKASFNLALESCPSTSYTLTYTHRIPLLNISVLMFMYILMVILVLSVKSGNNSCLSTWNKLVALYSFNQGIFLEIYVVASAVISTAKIKNWVSLVSILSFEPSLHKISESILNPYPDSEGH